MGNLLKESGRYGRQSGEIRLNNKSVRTRDGVVVCVLYTFAFLIFSLGFHQPAFADTAKNSLEHRGVIAIHERSEIIIADGEIRDDAMLYLM